MLPLVLPTASAPNPKFAYTVLQVR